MNKKINAAKKALEYVEEGKVIGLGSGTTAAEFVRLLAEKEHLGFKIDACVPTSLDARVCAIKHGLSRYLVDPDQVGGIDIGVDGADLVTKDYVLKGGGAALTREKIIAYNSDRFIVIADDSKIPKTNKATVAMEALTFSVPFTLRTLANMGYKARVRNGTGKIGPIISDNGNFIIDAEMEIKNAGNLESMLNCIPGLLENGIFTKFERVIVGTERGASEL